MKNNVFCIGNGESRKNILLSNFKNKGKIYGCNALYRDFSPDVLICADPGITHEVYDSGYAFENDCYFRYWKIFNEKDYDDLKYGPHVKKDKSLIKKISKYYTNITENEKQDSNSFALCGSSFELKKAIVERYENDENQKEQLDYEMNCIGLHISWIKNDKVKLLSDFLSKKEVNYCAGSNSVNLACKLENPKSVYLIGYDFNTQEYVNNIYKDTKHYAKSNKITSQKTNWYQQLKSIFEKYPDVTFYQVNEEIKIPVVWQNIKNLKYMTYKDLLNE